MCLLITSRNCLCAGPYTSQGSGPACANGELYGLSRRLLQTIGRLIDNAVSVWAQMLNGNITSSAHVLLICRTQAYIAFYLKSPVHTMWKLKYVILAPCVLFHCKSDFCLLISTFRVQAKKLSVYVGRSRRFGYV